MALMPGAVLKLIPPDQNDPPIKPRVLIFHVAVSEADSLYGLFLANQAPGGSKVESHFYIRRDGTIEQYRDTGYQADANTDANDFAISVETQGMADGEWTDEQMASLKRIALWCNKVHGVPLVKCPAWNGSGVGYHILFMQQWAGGPRACPGPDRIKQFNTDFVAWMAAGSPSPDQTPTRKGLFMYLTEAEERRILAAADALTNEERRRQLGNTDLTKSRADQLANAANYQNGVVAGIKSGMDAVSGAMRTLVSAVSPKSQG